MTYILPRKHAVVRLVASFDFMCRDKNIYFLYNYLFAVNVPARLRYIRYYRKSRHPGFAVHIGWFVLHSSALNYFVKARVLSIGAETTYFMNRDDRVLAQPPTGYQKN